jgi:hypothetical protein
MKPSAGAANPQSGLPPSRWRVVFSDPDLRGDRTWRTEVVMAEVSRSQEGFGLGSFGLRLLVALLMVYVTWNPAGYSYVDWAMSGWSAGAMGAPHAFVGVVLLIGWVILLRATYNSLGLLGLVLGAALLAVTVWLLIDLGILRGQSTSFISWVVLTCLGILLGIGLSWSYVWKRLTGQVDVEDFDRN